SLAIHGRANVEHAGNSEHIAKREPVNAWYLVLVKNGHAPNSLVPLGAKIKRYVGPWIATGLQAGSDETGEQYAGHEAASIGKEGAAQAVINRQAMRAILLASG